MKSNILLVPIFLLVLGGWFTSCGHSNNKYPVSNDKYTRMKNVTADIDITNVVGKMDFKNNHTFGIGGVNPMPMPQVVTEGIAKLRPSMIRIFIQDFFLFENDKGELDFSTLDKYIQSVSETGANIQAAICIKPKSLFPVMDASIWKPNNVERWQHIIEELVKRYSVDNKYVTHWAIGNEVDFGEGGGVPYYIPDPKDYFEYYKMTLEPVLKAYPQAKVGGSSWSGGKSENGDRFFNEFVGLCTKENIQLDFLSFNYYNDNPELIVECALWLRNIGIVNK